MTDEERAREAYMAWLGDNPGCADWAELGPHERAAWRRVVKAVKVGTLRDAYERGRAEALEEAARVCNEREAVWCRGDAPGLRPIARANEASAIGHRIRALARQHAEARFVETVFDAALARERHAAAGCDRGNPGRAHRREPRGDGDDFNDP